jgi:hypothetical protein
MQLRNAMGLERPAILRDGTGLELTEHDGLEEKRFIYTTNNIPKSPLCERNSFIFFLFFFGKT